jgi:NAD(P)-dependent dehydrogenase (short-subunit alcohol dehydrogenase family)
MPTELLSPDLVHTVDAIELPPAGSPVEGRSERRDSYSIAVTRSPEDTVERLLQLVGDARVAVITDDTVARLYGPLVIGALSKAGLEPEVATVPAGEQHKTLRQACELLDWLTGTQIGRRDVLVLLGGGVVIDMGGFVASSYMRGVPYVTLATTLIGQVDAGIGGKLAVNHPVAKNLFGSFHQPLGVISDVSFLKTLDRRQLRAGLAESIKKAIIASPAYYGEAGASAYCASKAAVIGLVRCLAVELAGAGFSVNAVAPGQIDTRMNSTDLETVSRREGRPAAELLQAHLDQRVPARRLGTPGEVAGLFAYLASPEARFITGEVIRIDGGELAGF